MKQIETRQIDFAIRAAFSGPNGEKFVIVSEAATGQDNFYYIRLTSLLALDVDVSRTIFQLVVPYSDKRVCPSMDSLYHFGSGSFLKATWNLTKRYLTEMYHLLREQRRVSFPRDSRDLFGREQLVILGAAFLELTGLSIHEELGKNNYQWERNGVYSTLFGRDSGQVNTPRTLNYYPEDHSIRVQWSLGSSQDDIKLYSAPGPNSSHGRYHENVFRVHRVYNGKPWKALYDMLNEDESLKAVVTAFYGSGLVSGPKPAYAAG